MKSLIAKKVVAAVAVAASLSVAVPAFAEPVLAKNAVSSVVLAADVTTDPHYQVPTDYMTAAGDAMFAINLGKLGMWTAVFLVLTQIAVFVIKQMEATVALMKKYGTLIILILSGLAAVLSSVVGGLSWPAALLVFATTAAPKFVNDLLHEIGVIEHGQPAPNAAPPTA